MAEINYTQKKFIRMLPAIVKDFIDNNVTYHFVDPLPTVMVFNVTSRCNSRCIMCDVWRNNKSPDVDTETVSKIFSDPFFKNIEIAGISGGEPTLRNDLKDIVEVIDHASDNLQKVIVTSNGLNRDRMSQQIEGVADYCQSHNFPFSFRISLDGLEEHHNAVRRVPEAYNKTMKSIESAKLLAEKYDFSFGVSSTLSPANVYGVRKLHALAKEIGVNIVYAYAYVIDAALRNKDLEHSIVLNEDARQYLAEFYKERILEGSLFDGEGYNYEFQIKHLNEQKDRTVLCPFSNQGIMLDANGDVHYCMNSRVIGNVLERPIQQIYFDKDNLEYRKNFPEDLCKTCYASCMTQVAARKKIYPYLYYLAKLAYYKMRHKM